MSHVFAPSADGPATESSFNAFGTGFDFASHFGYGKNPVIASPNTDSLEGDLSTSSGGVLRESVPQSYLSPSSTHMPSAVHTGCSTNTIVRHPSVDMRSLGPAYITLTQNNYQQPNGNSSNNSNRSFGASSTFFHFNTNTVVPTATANVNANTAAATTLEERPDEWGADNKIGLRDYAGLESLVMTTVGDGSNTPSPTHKGAAAAAHNAPLASLQTTPSNASVNGNRQRPASCNTDSVSQVPSRESNSAPQTGGSSPNFYSSDGAFLYSNFGPELIGSMPPPVLQTHTVDTTSPLVGATNPIAGAAIAAVPGKLSTHTNCVMSSSSCNVSRFVTSTGGNVSMGAQPNDAEVRSNLFICGLPVTVTDSDLTDIFGKYGPIESAKVMLDIHTGRSRGIAFVKFRNVEHAENAVDTLNGTLMNGHPITVRVANSRAAYLPGNPTNKTFVRNVPLAVSRSTLMEYFSQFGEVTDLSIKSDTAQGRHHGGRGHNTVALVAAEAAEDKLNIVFITYSTKEAAARAAEMTHTKTPFKECNGVPLLAKVAEDTTRRMERLSRRVRGSSGGDSSKDVSSSATTTLLNYAVQPGVMTPATLSVTAPTGGAASGFPAATYVTAPGLSTADLNGLTAVQASGNPQQQHQQQQPQQHVQQPQQLRVFRDANGNHYAAVAALVPATTGVTYTIQGPPQQPQQQLQQTVYIQTPNGLIASQVPQYQNLPQQHQQQNQQQMQMQVQQGAQGHVMYVQIANGSVVPVVYSGAAPNGTVQAQGMNPYYMMINN